MPSVNVPLRWFCFSTIRTRMPGRISLRLGVIIGNNKSPRKGVHSQDILSDALCFVSFGAQV